MGLHAVIQLRDDLGRLRAEAKEVENTVADPVPLWDVTYHPYGSKPKFQDAAGMPARDVVDYMKSMVISRDREAKNESS